MKNKKCFKYQVIGIVIGFIIAILILIPIIKYVKTDEPIIMFFIGSILGSTFSQAGRLIGMAIYYIKY